MKLFETLALLSRSNKRISMILIDVFGLTILTILAIWLRLGDSVDIYPYIPAIFLFTLLALPIFIVLGLYRSIVRHISHRFVLTVLGSVTLVCLVWAAGIFMLNLEYPRSAIVITWLLGLFFIASTRFVARWLLLEHAKKFKGLPCQSVIIFGAGCSGQQLLSALKQIDQYKVVAFIDDDVNLYKHEISSVKVYRRQDLSGLIQTYQVEAVFLAIPSLSANQRREVLEWLSGFDINVSTLPGLDEIVGGKVSFSDVRNVRIEDLLGRDPVPPNPALLAQCIRDKTVMISGAGGSIGSELCRQVLKQKPHTLVLYELSELALYQIERELLNLPDSQNLRIIAMLGSVLDGMKLRRVMAAYGVNTIYHAAAYKHVPMVEHNIQEGLYNNSFGTHLLARIAGEMGVENFVLISTDKAVRPTNVMGASKRLAEMALQALQVEYLDTRFIMVRFGNVLGSSGSVIPLFREQIAKGGPVTVTHKDMTRFFMTIPEAASLVIQAGSMGQGGEVFVLDMGKPVKIDYLARQVIKLSGFDVVNEQGVGDIEIQYSGLRPGEKLYEELLIGDQVQATEHARIMKAHEAYLPYSEFEQLLVSLEQALTAFDYDAVMKLLDQSVSGFHHTSSIVDYLNIDDEKKALYAQTA